MTALIRYLPFWSYPGDLTNGEVLVRRALCVLAGVATALVGRWVLP